jgi:hypothetical protein
MKVLALLGWAIVIGVVAGVLLDVTAFLVARYGPQADGWSLRGNGALIVPIGLGPAILAGGWTALASHYRGSPRWLVLGVAAFLVGTGFVVASVLVLVFFGSDAGAASSNALTLLILVWMVIAPWLARFVRTPAQKPRRGELGGHVIAGVFFAVAVFAAFAASGLVLAPGS